MLSTILSSKNLLSLLLPIAMLSACGGSDDIDSDDIGNANFSLAVSDAPVDELSAVVICFNQIQLKRNESAGGDLIFTVGGESPTIAANDLCLTSDGDIIPDTVGINLFDYTGSESINLITGAVIEAGDYTKMRIAMSDGSFGIDNNSKEKFRQFQRKRS